MSITNSSNKITYIGNGLTTKFPFSFKIFKTSDLQVILTNIESGTDTILTTNYTIDIANSYVTYPITGTPLTSTNKITLFRKVPITQETILPNQGAYFAKTVENALDKLTIVEQQLYDEIGRGLKLPVTTSDEISTVLPIPSAGQVLTWNDTGTAIINTIKFGTIDSKTIDGGNAFSIYLDKQKYDGGGA